eukprot:1158759-Pelagomonas_calceolata.AAC.11
MRPVRFASLTEGQHLLSSQTVVIAESSQSLVCEHMGSQPQHVGANTFPSSPLTGANMGVAHLHVYCVPLDIDKSTSAHCPMHTASAHWQAHIWALHTGMGMLLVHGYVGGGHWKRHMGIAHWQVQTAAAH